MGKKRTNKMFEALSGNVNASSNNEQSYANELSSTYVELQSFSSDNETILKLTEEVRRLNAENTELTERLAVYIESSSLSNSNFEISAELDKLRFANASLQNENDQYLVKISELAFENAKLTSQLQLLSKDNPSTEKPIQCNNEVNSDSRQNNMMAKSNFVSYNQTNGYNSWN